MNIPIPSPIRRFWVLFLPIISAGGFAVGANAVGAVSALSLGVAIGAALVFVAIAVMMFLNQSRDRREAIQESQTQQQAVLRLLDEITDLSKGDLTGNATVSEDFTGAIADSINYAIDTLRDLVGTIQGTATRLAGAANRTHDTAKQMSLNSRKQAHDVTQAASEIGTSSRQLKTVSGEAQDLATQAGNAVKVARAGVETAQRTTQSMDALRNQVQDTAKRLKSLAESTQEIGNVTTLISDIAEQTDTLALNASIQAAMAGEAGRGFAIVAGEVQRLAERATMATRKIAALVKNIQTDTSAVLVSMEQSTSTVISGTQSAGEAGTALRQAETVAATLSATISRISKAVNEQSDVAGRIASRMVAVSADAVKAATVAEHTSQQVNDLDALSDDLKRSIAGFKLPATATTPDVIRGWPGMELDKGPGAR